MRGAWLILALQGLCATAAFGADAKDDLKRARAVKCEPMLKYNGKKIGLSSRANSAAGGLGVQLNLEDVAVRKAADEVAALDAAAVAKCGAAKNLLVAGDRDRAARVLETTSEAADRVLDFYLVLGRDPEHATEIERKARDWKLRVTESDGQPKPEAAQVASPSNAPSVTGSWRTAFAFDKERSGVCPSGNEGAPVDPTVPLRISKSPDHDGIDLAVPDSKSPGQFYHLRGLREGDEWHLQRAERGDPKGWTWTGGMVRVTAERQLVGSLALYWPGTIESYNCEWSLTGILIDE